MAPCALFILLAAALAAACSETPTVSEPFREVSFESADGGKVFANLYGEGNHGVVLAHGKIFDKESWDPFARKLAGEGHRVLAIDFRGYGKSKPGSKGDVLYPDILGAVAYMKSRGAESVSVIGGSMGGGAAAHAAVEAEAGDIDKLILLSPVPIGDPGKIKAKGILYAASREERLAPAIRDQFEKAPEPKKLELLEGDAHAQHIFKTDQAEALEGLILAYLASP